MKKFKLIILRVITFVLLIGAGNVILHYFSDPMDETNVAAFNVLDETPGSQHYAEKTTVTNYYALPHFFTMAFENK